MTLDWSTLRNNYSLIDDFRYYVYTIWLPCWMCPLRDSVTWDLPRDSWTALNNPIILSNYIILTLMLLSSQTILSSSWRSIFGVFRIFISPNQLIRSSGVTPMTSLKDRLSNHVACSSLSDDTLSASWRSIFGMFRIFISPNQLIRSPGVTLGFRWPDDLECHH
jgi:hypothetical protein